MLKKIAILLGISAGVLAGAADFQDNFDKYPVMADGSPNWAICSGRWEFGNGVVRQLDQMFNGGLIFLDGRSYSDCTIKVRFKPAGSKRLVRAAGVVFRAKDCFNFYWIHFDCRNSQIVLARRTKSKSWLVVHRAKDIKIAADVWHDAEVSAIGKKITVKLDGRLIFEKEDGTFKAGRVGLRSGMGMLAFDDFAVSGQAADDSKFVMTQDTAEDKKTPRIQVPRVLANKTCGYFPVLVHLGGQKLGAVIRAGAGHVGITGRLDWITSEDGGKTWSKPTVIANSKWDDRNPAAYVTKDGKIAVVYSESSAYNAEGTFNVKYGTYDLFITESADGGKSWSPKRAIKFDNHPNQSAYGQGIVLSNGDIIVPWYWKGGGFIRSTDGGKTWQAPQVIARGSETAFVEVAPNELLALIRQNEGVFLLRSTDNGKSWSKPEQFTASGIHPASIIKLADGKLLAAVGSRKRPYGIKVLISKDKGASWKAENTAFISWDSANTDSGYPSVVQLADGSVAIVSYAVGSGLLPFVPQAQCAILSTEVLKNLSK
ncbi:MAG: hypothetical protein E7052_10060 [Lentisphaerae bacterium]|nr:hypothetical protein [Lentisphaerota bacterium]